MSDIAALTARIEKLEHELAVQQDIHQIRRLQYTYGYFIDKSQYDEVVDLFAASRDEVPRHPELVAGDGYHPSDAGYARWAELMWQRIATRIAG